MIGHPHLGLAQDMLPAGQGDCSLLKSLEWHSALRVKQAITVDFDASSTRRQYDENDPNSLFWPSFTLLCDAKEVQRRLFCENEEMIVIIEQSDIPDIDEKFSGNQEETISTCMSEHVTIQRFLAKSFKGALAPLATEICKTILPSLCQNLCLCIDLFEDSDRARVFEFFRVNRYGIHFDLHLLHFCIFQIRHLSTQYRVHP
jgi:hypothetical protein